jgi:hypothetical protein
MTLKIRFGVARIPDNGTASERLGNVVGINDVGGRCRALEHH